MSAIWPQPFGHPKGVAAVLDTSVLVRAWLSRVPPNPSRRVMGVAGDLYDSFVSPAILEEAEGVLARPSLAIGPSPVAKWLDAYVRASRQVFPESVPGGEARAVGGDVGDLPVLKTAYAANAEGAEVARILETARNDGGCFIISENTRHFVPGRNVYGWEFITASAFMRLLVRRERHST